MSNATKNAALGESYGAASNRLRKNVMFLLITLLKMDTCFQCGEKIESVDQLSVEHKQPWLSAPDPKAAFFDLNNIAFSHLSCNAGAARSVNAEKTNCPQGHAYRLQQRRCRECRPKDDPIKKRVWNQQGYSRKKNQALEAQLVRAPDF